MRRDQRQPHGAAHHDQRVQDGLGAAHHGRRAVLPVRTAGQEGQEPRAHLGQARRQHARRRGRRPRDHNGSARVADPGLLRHPRRQPLRRAVHAQVHSQPAREGQRHCHCLARRGWRQARHCHRRQARHRLCAHPQGAQEGQRGLAHGPRRCSRGQDRHPRRRHGRHVRHARARGRDAAAARCQAGACGQRAVPCAWHHADVAPRCRRCSPSSRTASSRAARSRRSTSPSSSRSSPPIRSRTRTSRRSAPRSRRSTSRACSPRPSGARTTASRCRTCLSMMRDGVRGRAGLKRWGRKVAVGGASLAQLLLEVRPQLALEVRRVGRQVGHLLLQRLDLVLLPVALGSDCGELGVALVQPLFEREALLLQVNLALRDAHDLLVQLDDLAGLAALDVADARLQRRLLLLGLGQERLLARALLAQFSGLLLELCELAPHGLEAALARRQLALELLDGLLVPVLDRLDVERVCVGELLALGRRVLLHLHDHLRLRPHLILQQPSLLALLRELALQVVLAPRQLGAFGLLLHAHPLRRLERRV
eukprot:Unigene6446_Nuclearia_a/m.19847 Unigene6446_Nuclearia_a/g.19847  ORF Unigene6446_Nuclearia_a/g.19847 Unigene6446_Nuclearia_a/m.19847 type:complete len:537 (-) Unigene6446_Nuclearia_a:225-1835(-)